MNLLGSHDIKSNVFFFSSPELRSLYTDNKDNIAPITPSIIKIRITEQCQNKLSEMKSPHWTGFDDRWNVYVWLTEGSSVKQTMETIFAGIKIAQL